MRIFLITAFSAVLVAACGAAEEQDLGAPSPPPPSAASGPSTLPPELGQEGPPPAWVETERGASWLGYSTYCWKTMCADYVAPRCGDERFTPTLVVTPGGTVRFHLGFKPTEVVLSRHSRVDEGQTVRLESAPESSWRVEWDGPVSLFARAAPGEGGADASYAACLKYEALTVAEAIAIGEGETVVEGPLWALGDDVRLCDAVAESYPPQCPSGYLQVRGLELRTVNDLKEASGVRWTEKPVRLRGVLEGNVLRVRG